jgi:hypothetical protein
MRKPWQHRFAALRIPLPHRAVKQIGIQTIYFHNDETPEWWRNFLRRQLAA